MVDPMRRLAAALLAVPGLWFFVPGLLSVAAAPGAGAGTAALPSAATSLVLGAALLTWSAVLWRTGARLAPTDLPRSSDQP